MRGKGRPPRGRRPASSGDDVWMRTASRAGPQGPGRLRFTKHKRPRVDLGYARVIRLFNGDSGSLNPKEALHGSVAGALAADPDPRRCRLLRHQRAALDRPDPARPLDRRFLRPRSGGTVVPLVT